MHEIALILVCLALGVVLRWSGRLPDNAGKVLSGWVINVALPAAALESFHKLTVHPDWWLAAATPWLGVAVAIAVLVPLCRALGWSRGRTGALILGAGWGNTSFVGLPMIAAFAGSQWLGLGIVIDLFGSYLALSTLGLAIAAVASEGRLDLKAVGKRIATFPPFIAILIAFATNHLDRPDWLDQIVTALAATLTPLALAAVGYALRIDRLKHHLAPLSVGLTHRLLLAPALLIGMYAALGDTSDPVAKIAMLEMAMPPMLGASVIAMDNDLEPDLIAALIGIGVPLSMLTAFGWWTLIAGF
ncbi:AEC family transporter [Ancylobacter sp. WKF20]|uniref:AEC family transporter n=1 Tax=Ancylobacter sp. WKF20 TaxID=3039801 RepID=UPI00243429B4|nr:AEC family transporter [Ancylobacter sp. WKF20]WGD29998.1 AEC family transporter [Ancylobacter sp. WKF20]